MFWIKQHSNRFWCMLGPVVKTWKIGRAEIYKLNVMNPLVKKLIEIDMIVSNQLVEEPA